MKIYFAGSIRAGRQDSSIYARLIEELKTHGQVLTEHVGYEDAKLSGLENTLSDKEVHDQDLGWLQEADVLVAEVTQASLGVGYEIGRAVAMGLKTICLFRPSPDKRLSCMIAGAVGPNFSVHNYQEVPQAVELLREEMTAMKKQLTNHSAAVEKGDNPDSTE